MYDAESIKRLNEMVAESSRIVFFGGAGVSTESGIPDYRSVDGLYSQKFKYPPEVMLSHSFFVTHTDEFYDFYRNKFLFLGFSPNPAHYKLAELEEAGKLSAIVTQNCDGLHFAAGSKRVFELHGSVHRNYCTKCHAFYDAEFIRDTTGVPKCEKCGGTVKPDVVLYEESLDGDTIDGAVKSISKSDMLIIGGTSLAVYPAAGMINYFRGKHLVVINRAPTSADAGAELVINGNIGEVLSQIEV